MSAPAFLHGVASGDPLHDRVVLWTRVSGAAGPVAVRWTVAADDALEQVVAEGTATAAPDADHTVHVDVAGLEPGTPYRFAFAAGEARSAVGRTRTLPAGHVEHLRFAVVSCAKYTAGFFNVYARLAERDGLDAVVHVGDYIYEYGDTDTPGSPARRIGRGMDPPHEAVTLADYRTRYAHYRRDPDVQAVHAAHPFIATLDDHELANDTWAGGAGSHDEASDGPWERRREGALQAWREWMPVRLPHPDEPDIVYRSFAAGDLADIVMVDGRTHRDREVSGPEMDAPDRTVLGRREHAWLLDQLRRSRARWRLIGNDVMIGQVFTGFMPDEIGNPLSEVGILTDRDHGPDPDQWDGYTAERDRIFATIADEGIDNVVFLSGDVHTAWAVDLRRDPHDRSEQPLAVELVTASITTENLDEHMGTEPRTASVPIERQVVAENPHVHWVDLDSHGYVLVDVTPERLRGEWWFVDRVDRPSRGERLAAAFEARAGENRLRRAPM